MLGKKSQNQEVNNNTPAGLTRQWAKTHEIFFGTQLDTFKQYTHSIFEGGILALSTPYHYQELYRVLTEDILQNAGRIVICEGFPHIYGSSTLLSLQSSRSNPLHIYPRLVARACHFLKKEIPRAYRTPMFVKRDTANLSWGTTCLAFDLDYGDVATRPYIEIELVKEISIIQQLMKQRGATRAEETECLVCLAEQDNKLGVHLYFYNSVYYPEECMQLAELTRHALQEQQPRPHCGTRSWSEVIDITIYNKTLRMPFLQKAKQCEVHKKGARSASCCAPFGKIYCDRRYWPIGIVKDGVMEEPWVQDIRGFIDQQDGKRSTVPAVKAKNNKTPIKQLKQQRPHFSKVGNQLLQRFTEQFGEEETKELLRPLRVDEVKDYIKIVLTIASLRCRKKMSKTQARFRVTDPIPNYPRPWKDFFTSVYEYAMQCIMNPEAIAQKKFFCPLSLKDYEIAMKEGRLKSDTLYFLLVKLAAYTNPLGEEFSNADLYGKEKRHEATLNAQEEKIRSKFDHILPKTNRDYDIDSLHKMATLDFASKLVDTKYTETLANDPFGRCLHLQLFIRERMETEHYRNLQIRKLIVSKYGDCLALIQGPGQHYCRIANKIHRRATIYFRVDRRTAQIRQYCYHSGCQVEGKERFWGIKMDPDLQALFTPQELLAAGQSKSKQPPEKNPPMMHAGRPIKLSTPTRVLSEEQKRNADSVIQQFTMYSQPIRRLPKTNVAAKKKIAQDLKDSVSLKVEAPSTPSSFSLSLHQNDSSGKESKNDLLKEPGGAFGKETKDTLGKETKDTVGKEPGGAFGKEPGGAFGKDSKDTSETKRKNPAPRLIRPILENVANSGISITAVDNPILSDDDDRKENEKEKNMIPLFQEQKEASDGQFEFDDEGQLVFVTAKHLHKASEKETTNQEEIVPPNEPVTISKFMDLFQE